MSNNISHFAIHADDLPRAMAFYQAVFGWRFQAWGPPGFYLIATGSQDNPGIPGALHQRMEPLTGTGMQGFECTIGVEDVHATAQAVEANGGVVVMAPVMIPTVGTLIKFRDTEGNLAGAMQYDGDNS